MTIKNSLVKLLLVGTVLASPSLEAGKSSYDSQYGILTVSRKKVEKLGTGQITDKILTIKGQSYKVNGSISYLPPYEPESFTGFKGDHNTFSLEGINLPDAGIDPETGLPIENQYMPPSFPYLSLTFEPSDSPITVSKITCAPTVEKTTSQPSVQKASTSLPKQGDPSFFSAFDETTRLWYGMECLTTKKAIAWWKNRLGIDTWFVYGASVQAFDATPTPDEILQSAQNSSYSLDPWTTVRQMMSCPTEGPWAQDLQSRVAKEFNELTKDGYHHGIDSPKWENMPYLDAFRGFQANLEKASGTFPVWVSYFADRDLKDRASEALTPDDPAIKISMTAILDHKFYTPLGIYVNPIARELDGEAGKPHPKISVPLHRQLAQHVQQITPESEYMILRPLHSMTQALTKANVKSASFSGFESASQNGVQFKFTGNFGGWSGTSISYTFTTKDGTVYEVPNWFNSHDFVGAVNNRENLEYLPFVVADIEDLKK